MMMLMTNMGYMIIIHDDFDDDDDDDKYGLHDYHIMMILMMMMMMTMQLLARIWESEVREEKEENADDKDETKQAAQNQLHFHFHLWIMIVAMMNMIKWMVKWIRPTVSEKKHCKMKKRPCMYTGNHHYICHLGVTGFPKLDVFLENSQTAFDPPPPHFWKLHCAFFCENL